MSEIVLPPPTNRETPSPHPAVASEGVKPTGKNSSPPPFLLDFIPLEDAKQTRLSPFFDALRAGRLTTTRCAKDQLVHWPPRVVCPRCHRSELAWVDLPATGSVYAFSAVLAGAPLGMEADVPFVVGLIDLPGVGLRVFARIVGTTWDRCRVGERVAFEPYDLSDGRVFFRFRAAPGDVGPKLA